MIISKNFNPEARTRICRFAVTDTVDRPIQDGADIYGVRKTLPV